MAVSSIVAYRIAASPSTARTHAMIRKTAILLVPLVTLAGFLLACSSPETPADRQIDRRLIEETSEVFGRQQVARWQEVFSWTFQDADDLAPWRQQGFDLISRPMEGHWRLGASEPGAYIERQTDLDSSTFGRLEVILGGTGRRPLRLQWAGPGEPFTPQRSLEVRGEGEAGRYVFDLMSHPLWRGKIAQLRLQPLIPSKLRGRLFSIRGQRSVATPARRQRASQRPLKVTLGGTTRTARLVLPGKPLVETMAIADGSRLEAAFGIDSAVPHAMSFRILGRDAQGEDHTLFTGRVASAASGHRDDPAAASSATDALPADRWHSLDLDLTPWQGQDLEIHFSADGIGTPAEGPVDAYGFWGDVRRTQPLDGPPPPNVVLVVIDTLRADHLSLYGYPRATSPNLERWAARHALTFRSVVAAAPWTYPSHLSLFTGLDPLSHGQHHPRPLPQRFDLLAQQLQRAGYETMAVTAGGYLDAHYGFARGFDRYAVISGHLGPKGDLEDGIERALQWTAEAHRPYFLFLHTYEVHTPHRVRTPFHRQLSGRDGDPDRLRRLTTRRLPTGDTAGAVRRKTYAWNDGSGGLEDLAEGELQQVIDAYDSAIAYTDHHLSRLLDALADDDDREMVIITSDHGEALGEHGLADHAYLYDVNLRIPLLISLPDRRGAGQWVEEQVRQIDVAPTVLAALDLPGRAVDGTSLMPYADDPTYRRPAEAKEAWSATAYQGLSLRRGNRLKYIFNPTLWQRQKARQALFLLDRDADEANNLADDHAATSELEQLAIGRFMESFDGLLISIENPSSQEFQLALGGPHWLGPQFFKSVDAPAEALRWGDDRRLQVQVGAGERFSLVVEQVAPEDGLTLEVTGAEGKCSLPPIADPASKADVAADAPSPGVLQRTFGATCDEADEPTGDLTLTLLYRHPSRGADAAMGDELPAALQEQLRALGYLD